MLPIFGSERRAVAGIAGLSAAAHLVDDCHVPGKNIYVLEALPEVGGSMDGTGEAKTGYLCRSEREFEPNMECLWNLCAKVPSLCHPGRTVLDDVWEYNYEHPLHNEYRLVVKGKAIDEIFPPEYFKSTLWLTCHNMLSFKPSHSVIESKRYFRRFTHFMPESDYEHGILHTDLNEYDAIILPLRTWLESRGVQFNCGVEVTEIQTDDAHNTVTGLLYETSGRECDLRVDPRDMVIFTNDSMTQNSAFGNNTTVAPTFYDARYIVALLKKINNIRGDVSARDLPKPNPIKMKEMGDQLLKQVNGLEEYPTLWPGKNEPPAKYTRNARAPRGFPGRPRIAIG